MMRRMRLFLFPLALLISMFGFTAFTGITVAAAQATHTTHSANAARASTPHATCSGNGCNGLDPVKAGCDGSAYTVQTAVFSNSYVQLRYSRTCGTNWGRVFSKVGPTRLVIRNQRIDGLTYTFAGGNFNYAWSAMVYAPNVKARACGGVNGISGCTAYV